MFLFARVCMHLSVGSTVQTGRCFMRGTAFHFALPLVCSDCRVYVHCEHPPLLDISTSIHFAGFNGDYAVHMAVHFDRAGLQQVTKYLRPACVHDCSNYDHRVSSSWCWHQPSPLFSEVAGEEVSQSSEYTLSRLRHISAFGAEKLRELFRGLAQGPRIWNEDLHRFWALTHRSATLVRDLGFILITVSTIFCLAYACTISSSNLAPQHSHLMPVPMQFACAR